MTTGMPRISEPEDTVTIEVDAVALHTVVRLARDCREYFRQHDQQDALNLAENVMDLFDDYVKEHPLP